MKNEKYSSVFTEAHFEKIENSKLIDHAKKINLFGSLNFKKNENSFYNYLSISNNFIDQLFPIINIPNVNIPSLKKDNDIGAHITFSYDLEHVILEEKDIEQKHDFTIKDFGIYPFKIKDYFVLRIESDSLTSLRKKYKLPSKLHCGNHFLVDFHITIGKKIHYSF